MSPNPGSHSAAFTNMHSRNAWSVTLASRTLTIIALVQHGLFDDLIRAQQQRLRDREAERLGGLEVDDELEFAWLLDGKIGWLCASEDLVHEGRRIPLQLKRI